MIIDTHTHVIATDTKKYPLAPLFGKQSTWSAEHPLNYPDLVKAHIEAGVDKAVLVQASSAYAFDNSYTADSVAAHPERFTGVFSVDVVAPDAPEKMKHWMSRGLTGMRIFTSGSTQAAQTTFFAEEAAFPAWQYANDTSLSVCMQMRLEGLPLLETLLKRFPKAPVILDHFARAEAADGGVDLDHLTARFDGQTSVLNRSDLQHAGAGLEFFGGKRGQSGNSGKRKQKREPFHAAIIRRDIV